MILIMLFFVSSKPGQVNNIDKNQEITGTVVLQPIIQSLFYDISIHWIVLALSPLTMLVASLYIYR